MDGTETPIQNDLSHTIVSVKKVAPDAIEQTNKHDGRIEEIDRFTVSADGKTLAIYMEDRIKETIRQFIAHRR